VETNIESGTYYFSLAQEQSENTSEYGSSDKFALAMFQRSAPTLLAYDGTYAHLKEMNVKNIEPSAFHFGIGGPKTKQKVKVSMSFAFSYTRSFPYGNSWTVQQSS
jgi:hypothetical protein